MNWMHHAETKLMWKGGRCYPRLFKETNTLLVTGLAFLLFYNSGRLHLDLFVGEKSSSDHGTGPPSTYPFVTTRGLYPQNEQPVDVFADMHSTVQDSWNCSECKWWLCSNERSLFDEYMVKCFQRWTEITHELGILSVSIYGSLIASYHRNATIMKWEMDFDVWVWAHDIITLKEHQESYNEKHRNESWIEMNKMDWKAKREKLDGYQRAARFHYELPQQFGEYDHSVHVDINPIYPDACNPHESMNHCCRLAESGNYSTVEILTKRYERMQMPKSELFPLESCYLNGVHATCPSNPEKVLHYLYHGEDVATPDHILNRTTGCWVNNSSNRNSSNGFLRSNE